MSEPRSSDQTACLLAQLSRAWGAGRALAVASRNLSHIAQMAGEQTNAGQTSHAMASHADVSRTLSLSRPLRPATPGTLSSDPPPSCPSAQRRPGSAAPPHRALSGKPMTCDGHSLAFETFCIARLAVPYLHAECTQACSSAMLQQTIVESWTAYVFFQVHEQPRPTQARDSSHNNLTPCT